MIKQFFKKVLISYLIIICCIFAPTYRAYAASPAGWSFSAFDVATSVVTALKNGASASVTVAKSPITSKIAKGIVGGAIVGAALPLAISQITGIALSALDWVLDPANNTIKYKDKSGAYSLTDPVCTVGPNIGQRASSTGLDEWTYHGIDKASGFAAFDNGGDYVLTVQCVKAVPYTPNYKTIPIPTVANKIYDNAKTDSESRSVVNDAVRDYVNEGSADVALDNAKADADATHNCGTGTHWSGSACVADTPTTPTTPTTDTPFDPSGIIDAIKSVFDAVKSVFDAVMSLPDVINNALDDLLVNIKDFFQPVIDSVTNFFDWVKTTYDEFVKPADDEPTQLDIPDNLPTPTDTNLRFGGMCPPNAEINVRIPFATINATLFDWSKWCYNLETFVKPVIILLAAYFSVLIFRGKNESS